MLAFERIFFRKLAASNTFLMKKISGKKNCDKYSIGLAIISSRGDSGRAVFLKLNQLLIFVEYFLFKSNERFWLMFFIPL